MAFHLHVTEPSTTQTIATSRIAPRILSGRPSMAPQIHLMLACPMPGVHPDRVSVTWAICKSIPLQESGRPPYTPSASPGPPTLASHPHTHPTSLTAVILLWTHNSRSTLSPVLPSQSAMPFQALARAVSGTIAKLNSTTSLIVACAATFANTIAVNGEAPHAASGAAPAAVNRCYSRTSPSTSQNAISSRWQRHVQDVEAYLPARTPSNATSLRVAPLDTFETNDHLPLRRYASRHLRRRTSD